jgi:hypothetical protein
MYNTTYEIEFGTYSLKAGISLVIKLAFSTGLKKLILSENWIK